MATSCQMGIGAAPGDCPANGTHHLAGALRLDPTAAVAPNVDLVP
ncbi:hypothetical protein EV186_11221 [Labedaea rhizosphaerae]|uniref:Uncharacterized protein n=1 Tax=Labedaea rhizosphaerae TaxID=598644 RepID=A0A4R6RRZ2_LABRH|nr:hypothetical protein EV186_11221 [Labedaea rhizosphaerae]